MKQMVLTTTVAVVAALGYPQLAIAQAVTIVPVVRAGMPATLRVTSPTIPSSVTVSKIEVAPAAANRLTVRLTSTSGASSVISASQVRFGTAVARAVAQAESGGTGASAVVVVSERRAQSWTARSVLVVPPPPPPERTETPHAHAAGEEEECYISADRTMHCWKRP